MYMPQCDRLERPVESHTPHRDICREDVKVEATHSTWEEASDVAPLLASHRASRSDESSRCVPPHSREHGPLPCPPMSRAETGRGTLRRSHEAHNPCQCRHPHDFEYQIIRAGYSPATHRPAAHRPSPTEFELCMAMPCASYPVYAKGQTLLPNVGPWHLARGLRETTRVTVQKQVMQIGGGQPKHHG